MDLDGLGVDRPVRVDTGTPRLALAPALAFAQHFHETDFDDDARGFPGKWLLKIESWAFCYSKRREKSNALIQVRVIKDAFSKEQKRQIISKS